jgi:thiamine pyrophosphokinase
VGAPTPQDTTHRKAVVFAGGGMHLHPVVDDDALVVAADSGYDNARSAEIAVDVLVGDMDSISPEGLLHAEQHDVAIARYPADKDETDLELAIDAAVTSGALSIAIYGGEGGRPSHLFGIGLTLANAKWSHVAIAWHIKSATVQVTLPSRPVSVEKRTGAVSLLPVGNVRGVTTTGLQWALNDDDLAAGTTRGLSNRMTHTTATVSVGDGAVLVVAEEPSDENTR